MKMFYIPGLHPRPTRQTETEPTAAWWRDPLSHPALDAMSERELADLPFTRPTAAARPCESARCAG